jgi:hypothetical protein
MPRCFDASKRMFTIVAECMLSMGTAEFFVVPQQDQAGRNLLRPIHGALRDWCEGEGGSRGCCRNHLGQAAIVLW